MVVLAAACHGEPGVAIGLVGFIAGAIFTAVLFAARG